MSKFDYPTLTLHDIIVVLAESQIAAVTEADLLRPDPDFICKVYTHIHVHMDILKDDQEQMQFEALEHLENPEHHMNAIQTMDLCVKLRQLLAAIKCPKLFTPKDLIRPEPDRTEFFLGALLNFHLHRNMRMDLRKPYFDGLEQLEQQTQAAEAKIKQLNAEIAEIEALIEMEEPHVREARLKKEELHQTVDELNKHQATLRTKIKQLKEKGKECDEKISDAEFALVQCAQENASLRSKIVQSPDKLQRALEEKRLALDKAKDAERAAIQSCQDKSAKLEAYDKACKKISKHLGQMQAVQEQVNSAKSVEKDLKILKSKLSDKDVQIKSLEAKLVEMQSRADQLEDSIRKMEKENAMRREEAEKEVDNVKIEVESKRRTLELRNRQLESVVAEADAINSKKQNVREEAEAKIRELGRKSEDIVSEDKSCGEVPLQPLPPPPSIGASDTENTIGESSAAAAVPESVQLPLQPPPPLLDDTSIHPPPSEVAPAKRRKSGPCYGWIESDEEDGDLELIDLPPMVMMMKRRDVKPGDV